MHREIDNNDSAVGVDKVLADYMRRVDLGEAIDPDAIIAAYPELASELRKYFSQAQAIERFADGVTADFGHQATPRSGLEVRCPSCHAPMEVAVDTALTDLTCSTCGSHFSLVDQSKATRMAPSLSTLGRFELIERLGVGGFGSVWKARDTELDRTVAVKIPRALDMTPEEQDKFFREARAAAQLRHPNIVSVHEVGRDGDSVYIVSDLVRGVTLGDWLTGQQLTSREAAELCTKIAKALHHAHEHGVVHRDLKPANIMIDNNGEPHLMDFGLARREVGEVTMTIDGQVLGTPAYMSPEQAQGEAHKADRRSDIYSLGVILFQLLTGELPFRGNARMLLHQMINEEPPSPRNLNSNVPKDLETITLKCLEKDPTRRYQNAFELLEELRRFLAGEPIKARPIGRLARAARWAKRRPAAAALLALLILVAAGSVAAFVRERDLRRELSTQKNEAERRRIEADEQRLEAQEQRREAQELFANSLFERAATECNAGQPSHGITLLAAAIRAMRNDNPLRQSTLNLMSMWSPRVGKLMLHDERVRDVAFSPDGRIAATVTREKQVQLWDAHTCKPIGKPIVSDNTARAARFSPDGTLVATGGTDALVRLFDARTGSQVGPGMKNAFKINAIAFNPDGFVLAVATGAGQSRGEVRFWDIRTHRPVGRPIASGSEVWSVAYSKDGRRLITGSADRTARLWDLKSNQPIGQPSCIKDG